MILGITFKENVNDIRNSKAINICNLLKKKNIIFDIYDPLVNNKNFLSLKEFNFIKKINYKKYNLILLTVGHNKFKKIQKLELENCPNLEIEKKNFNIKVLFHLKYSGLNSKSTKELDNIKRLQQK